MKQNTQLRTDKVAPKRDVDNDQKGRPNDWLSRISQDETMPNYTSQRGEDRILSKIFEMIGIRHAWCVEFGAADGKRGSNTWNFINNQGWRSVQIEPKRDTHLTLAQKRDSFDALVDRYGDNERVICVSDAVEESGEHSLDAMLSRTGVPKEFDLLSIDVDGNDYAIWESLTAFAPRVVVIEHNKTYPIDLDFCSDQGSSLRALARLGKEKGYELVAATIVNGIFVRSEYYDVFNIQDNDPRYIWPDHTVYQKYIFQLYDGTVVIVGDNKIRWSRGVDGTLAGQLKSGRFVCLETGAKRLLTRGGNLEVRNKLLISGMVRSFLYKIMSRI